MLKKFFKVFKYDFMAIAKYWWILAIVMPVVGLASALSIRTGIESLEFALGDAYYTGAINDVQSMIMTFAGYFAVLIGYVGSIVFFGTSIVTEILLFVRFYKHFFTDEGYLTFTLPVSRKTLYLSKIVNAVFWTLLHLAVMGVGIVAMALIIPPSDYGCWLFDPDFHSFLKGLWETMTYDAESVRVSIQVILWLIVLAVIGIVLLIGYVFMSISLTSMSISFGSTIVKRGKLFSAIGCWYLMNSLVGNVMSGVSTVAYYLFFSVMTFATDLNVNAVMFVIALLSLIATLMCWCAAFIFYLTTQSIIERRLNLA